jgi:hypothetical protein
VGRSLFIAFVWAVAKNSLAVASWTALDIATRTYVELSLDDPAIMARLPVGTPIVRLIPVPDARQWLSSNDVMSDRLRCLNSGGPLRTHRDAVVNHLIFSHMSASCRLTTSQRRAASKVPCLEEWPTIAGLRRHSTVNYA